MRPFQLIQDIGKRLLKVLAVMAGTHGPFVPEFLPEIDVFDLADGPLHL